MMTCSTSTDRKPVNSQTNNIPDNKEQGEIEVRVNTLKLSVNIRGTIKL